MTYNVSSGTLNSTLPAKCHVYWGINVGIQPPGLSFVIPGQTKSYHILLDIMSYLDVSLV